MAEIIRFGECNKNAALHDEMLIFNGMVMNDDDRRQTRAVVEQALRHRWPAVEALAARLSQPPVTISGDDAEGLIEETLGPLGISRPARFQVVIRQQAEDA